MKYARISGTLAVFRNINKIPIGWIIDLMNIAVFAHFSHLQPIFHLKWIALQNCINLFFACAN